MRESDFSADVFDLLKHQRQAFKKKFGREPEPNDPVFFDPDAEEPCFMSTSQVIEIDRSICGAPDTVRDLVASKRSQLRGCQRARHFE